MQFQEFVSAVIRTEAPPVTELTPEQGRLLHAVMGIATEAGELLDQVKKHLFYKKPLDLVNVKEEAGDLAYYLAMLFDIFGWTDEEVRALITAKLRKRYPDGFDSHKAVNRDLVAERHILEGKDDSHTS